jgi:hypothetical protein
MMKLAIMQPYFFPYIGYFQLMKAVDQFVVYDNIEFTRKGWINRNRILVNNADAFISLPLKKDSDFLFVKDRYLADSWPEDRLKMINRIKESYRKAPYFESVFPFLEACLKHEDSNLFGFIFHTLSALKQWLQIPTPFVVSSSISADHTLKAELKVMALCKASQSDVYINPIGGLELYDKDSFLNEGIKLQFIKSRDVKYKQFQNEFVPWLSIIDVMMFNPPEEIQRYLEESFDLI